jgi:hypothetical protein
MGIEAESVESHREIVKRVSAAKWKGELQCEPQASKQSGGRRSRLEKYPQSLLACIVLETAWNSSKNSSGLIAGLDIYRRRNC